MREVNEKGLFDCLFVCLFVCSFDENKRPYGVNVALIWAETASDYASIVTDIIPLY